MPRMRLENLRGWGAFDTELAGRKILLANEPPCSGLAEAFGIWTVPHVVLPRGTALTVARSRSVQPLSLFVWRKLGQLVGAGSTLRILAISRET
ncbi:hypothetical protein D3C80_388340 [compost metagenome]